MLNHLISFGINDFSNAYGIGPMHEEKFLGNTPITPITKSGNSPIVSAVLTVFETLKNIDFQVGIPTFKNETKTRQLVLMGVFPKIFSSCIGPIWHGVLVRYRLDEIHLYTRFCTKEIENMKEGYQQFLFCLTLIFGPLIKLLTPLKGGD